MCWWWTIVEWLMMMRRYFYFTSLNKFIIICWIYWIIASSIDVFFSLSILQWPKFSFYIQIANKRTKSMKRYNNFIHYYYYTLYSVLYTHRDSICYAFPSNYFFFLFFSLRLTFSFVSLQSYTLHDASVFKFTLQTINIVHRINVVVVVAFCHLNRRNTSKNYFFYLLLFEGVKYRRRIRF